jgi:hypothetical protein
MDMREEALKAFDAAAEATTSQELKDQIQQLKEQIMKRDAAPAEEAPVEKAADEK